VVGWGLLAGLWLRTVQGFGGWSTASRLAAVGVPVLVVAVAPGVLWATGLMGSSRAGAGVTDGWMWTPVTAVWEVVRDRAWSGRSAWVGSGHWRWAVSALALGLLGHVFAGVASAR